MLKEYTKEEAIERITELEIEIDRLKRYSDLLEQQALESNLEMAKALIESGKATKLATENFLKACDIINALEKEVNKYKKR